MKYELKKVILLEYILSKHYSLEWFNKARAGTKLMLRYKEIHPILFIWFFFGKSMLQEDWIVISIDVSISGIIFFQIH